MNKLRLLVLLLLTSSLSKAQSFTWTGNMPIFDNTSDTIFLNVSGLPNQIDTSFGLGSICFDITHTYDGDLRMYLISPDGSSRTLILNNGGSGDNFIGTCLAMDGTPIANSKPPYTGLIAPSTDISTLNNNQNPNGIWKFIVSDVANADTGSIHYVNLSFTNNPPRATAPVVISGPTGTYVWPGAVCPGGASGCDLLPDMTSSYRDINLNHQETPGFLAISNTTPNIGYGPMEIFAIDSCFCGTTYVPCTDPCAQGIKHTVKQRIYTKVPGTDTLSYWDRVAGRMTYHPQHNHLHVDNWVNYTLRTATSNPDARTWPIVGTGTKQSFCLVNLGVCSNSPGTCLDNNGNTLLTVPNQNLGFHTGCGLNQGIYPGNYDVYSISLNDPIVLTNVCNGNYYIVSITDPDNLFVESDETNNWVAVPITLTQQSVAPVITANRTTTLCPGDSVILTSTTAANYLWSTGDTTRSITVRTGGNYTVSTNCGTSIGTSAPMTVILNQINMAPATVPAAQVCNGDVLTLNAGVTSTASQNMPVSFTNSTHVFIPDNVTAGVTSPITVSGISPATLQTTSIVSVSLTLTHTYDSDLEISLIAPGGGSIILSNRRGGSGDNFTNTVFSMAASTLISAGTAPFSGSYRPDGNFASLTGNVNGTWQLKVRDIAAADTGRIRSWSISINNLAPETFNYAWSAPGFNSTQISPSVSPVTSTTYTATVTSNATGCTKTAFLNVFSPDTISLTNVFPVSAMPGQIITISGRGFNGASSVTIGGVPAGFMVLSNNQLQAMVPSLPVGANAICVAGPNGCVACNNLSVSVQSSVSFNFKLFIEGFYRGSGNMVATIDPVRNPASCDTIIVRLHNPTSPFAIVNTTTLILSTNGTATLFLPSSFNGNSYYISLHHRNAIETWSALPVLISDGGLYDFSTAASKAYGNNQKSLGDGNYALYSGDISNFSQLLLQDGIIDLFDLNKLESESKLFMAGYYMADLTGDRLTESADYSLVENNIPLTITVRKP